MPTANVAVAMTVSTIQRISRVSRLVISVRTRAISADNGVSRFAISAAPRRRRPENWLTQTGYHQTVTMAFLADAVAAILTAPGPVIMTERIASTFNRAEARRRPREGRIAHPFGFRLHRSERAAFPHSAPPEVERSIRHAPGGGA